MPMQDRTLLDDDQCKYVAIFNIARKAPWGEGDGVRTIDYGRCRKSGEDVRD